jgi:peptide/nickel transport system ATP-binding protein
MAYPLLSVAGFTKHFNVRGGTVKAVDDVSFDLAEGEVLGVVGESGCGKSTTARLIMGLIAADRGRVALDGREGVDLRALRRQVQMVFQDSYSSLNPRMPAADSIAFAAWMHGASRRDALAAAHGLLEEVGLAPQQFAGRYPHELSGGQRQRVNIARALANAPRVVLLDEAVSALDKSVEAQILNLLVRLKRDRNLTYLFISHDLNVIEYISDRVVVMYLGRVVEEGAVADIYHRPAHPYTRALLASKLSADPRRRLERAPITGDPPNPVNPPSGCRFRTRCAFAEPVCANTVPALVPVGDATHRVACLMAQPGSGHSRA